jgi:hypothetical protein
LPWTRIGSVPFANENVYTPDMIEPTHHPLPTPANENRNPLHRADTALLELHRLRRQLVTKDKSGYSAEQWRSYHDLLKEVDAVLRDLEPYL